MQDDQFWELEESYDRGKISAEDVIKDICRSTKNYNVATADISIILKRPITKEEKLQIKEILDAKNNKRGSKPSKGKEK